MGAEDLEQRSHLFGGGEALDSTGDVGGFSGIGAGKLFGALATLMAGFSCYLIFVQAYYINAFCQFCLLSALTSMTMFLLFIVSLFAKPKPESI